MSMTCPRCNSSNGKPYMALDNETKQLVYNPRIRVCTDCGYQDMMYKFGEADSVEEENEEMMPLPAPRRQGTIKVNLVYGGKAKPPVADDPYEDSLGKFEVQTERFEYDGEQPLVSKKMLCCLIIALIIAVLIMAIC